MQRNNRYYPSWDVPSGGVSPVGPCPVYRRHDRDAKGSGVEVKIRAELALVLCATLDALVLYWAISREAADSGGSALTPIRLLSPRGLFYMVFGTKIEEVLRLPSSVTTPTDGGYSFFTVVVVMLYIDPRVDRAVFLRKWSLLLSCIAQLLLVVDSS